jgi:undecaprenyl diphosphate synthase
MNPLNHLAIIMDGNRRWAKRHNLSSHKGHDKGADIFIDLCEWCIDFNIKHLTVYAFSTENWKRTQIEVAHIFGLLERFFTANIQKCIKEGIAVNIIGDSSRFDKKTQAVVEKVQSQTAHCKKLKVQIALSYGGRDEIVRAVRNLSHDIVQNKIKPEQITENTFAAYLDTAGTPDADLVIRTGGAENIRLSNFLPWQTVYSQLYFSELLWPDFSREELQKAIDSYNLSDIKQGK